MRRERTNVITLEVKEKTLLLHEFNRNALSSEVIEYLNTEVKRTSLKEKVIINVKFPNLKESEKEEITDLIQDYYEMKEEETAYFHKFRKIKKVSLMILGVILILLSSILSNLNIYLIPELLLIAGWVAIWELVDDLLFTDLEKKIKEKRNHQLARAEITFNNSAK